MEDGSISIFPLVMGAAFGLYALGALRTFLSLQDWSKAGHDWRHQLYKQLIYQGASRRVAYEESQKSQLWSLTKAAVVGFLSAIFVAGGLHWF